MADVVVLGAGLGGTLMAYEMVPELGPSDRLTVIGQGPGYHFVPSNPWVAVGWRKRRDIEIDLATVMEQKRITYRPEGAARVHPDENRVELTDGSSVPYDYLVIATGPELAFDEIEGLGPKANTQSICHVDHADKAHAAFEEFCKNPGPIIVGAVQGASCFGPAYEFAFILDTELRRRKIRDHVPMTFVTSEPYIGHLGLDGVGDTKGLLESALRDHHIKWITNARVKSIDAGKMTIETVAEGGAVDKTQEMPVQLRHDAAGLPRRRRGDGRRGPGQSARLHPHRQAPAQSQISQRVRHRRVHCHSAGRPDTGSGGRAQDRLHDRIHGDGDGAQYRPPAQGPGTRHRGDLECDLPGRFRRRWRGLRGPAANSAAQRQLVARRANGCITPRSASRNISCTRCAAAKANPSMKAGC